MLLAGFHLFAAAAACQALNILNNGGFETGLMCYADWVWSNTGQDFKSDYKFLLSSDAHSGKYPLEIRCTGPDCLGGATAWKAIGAR